MAWRDTADAILAVSLRLCPLFISDLTLNGTFIEVIRKKCGWSEDESWASWILMFFLSFNIVQTMTVMFLLKVRHLLLGHQFLTYIAVVATSLSCSRLFLIYTAAQQASTQDLSHWLSLHTNSQGLLHKLSSQCGSVLVQFGVQVVLTALLGVVRSSLNPFIYNRGRWSKLVFHLLWFGTGLSFLSTLLFHQCGWDAEGGVIVTCCSLVLPVLEMACIIGNAMMHAAQQFWSMVAHVQYIVSNFGLQALIEAEWTRLRVPDVFTTFWFLKMAYCSVVYYLGHVHKEPDGFIPSFMQHLILGGSETLVSVFATTAIVSHITHAIGVAVMYFLQSEEDDDRSFGLVSGVLFIILALQTGITSLQAQSRVWRLYRNFWLLFSAVLHYVHSLASPLLLTRAAGQNRNWALQGRVLALCLFLLLVPVGVMKYVWAYHTLSTWLLAVSAFSLELMVKVLVTLAQYALFLFDQFHSGYWLGLDDALYLIRATGAVIEFGFGTFLFGNGLYILIVEQYGAIRALMICIHAYFNIWQQARDGWRSFKRRRTAVNKIHQLAAATPEELAQHNDVCSICYEELTSACVTSCGHIFHSVCLRKWLYVQDRCPMCHQYVLKPTKRGKSRGRGGNQADDGREERVMQDRGVQIDADAVGLAGLGEQEGMLRRRVVPED